MPECDASDFYLLQKLLSLLETHPWGSISMDQMALKLDMVPSVLRALYPTPETILQAFFQQTDDHTCTAVRNLGPVPFRDLLLEALMIRLDVLNPHKNLVRHLSMESLLHPCLAAALLTQTIQGLQKMLQAMGQDPSPSQYLLAGIVYGRGLWAWLGDTSSDQEVTLAAMDQCLRTLETPFGL